MARKIALRHCLRGLLVGVLAAVLKLGNLKFNEAPGDDGSGGPKSSIATAPKQAATSHGPPLSLMLNGDDGLARVDQVVLLTELLGCTVDELSAILTTRVMETRSESVVLTLGAADARAVSDAMCKVCSLTAPTLHVSLHPRFSMPESSRTHVYGLRALTVCDGV